MATIPEQSFIKSLRQARHAVGKINVGALDKEKQEPWRGYVAVIERELNATIKLAEDLL